jgi:MFS family permease
LVYASLATTATNALIADYFTGQRRAKFMGYQSAFGGLSVIFFLPIGGFLADIAWEYAFLVYLSVLLVFIPALFAIHEPKVSRQQKGSPNRSRLTLTPTLGLIYGGTFILQFAFMTIPIYIAYYMGDLLGVGGFEVGLVGGLSGLLTFFGGMVYERTGRRLSYQSLFVGGFLLLGAGFMALALANTWTLVIVGQAIAGFGMGLNMANLTTWLAHEANPEVRGRANGVFVTLMFLGQFVTSLVFTPIVTRTNYNFGFFSKFDYSAWYWLCRFADEKIFQSILENLTSDVLHGLCTGILERIHCWTRKLAWPGWQER